MDGAQLRQCAARRALELPGVYQDHPFGPDWEVFRVRGKIFMLQTELGSAALVNLKTTPAGSTALRSAYTAITPGYHMNKKHWITLHPHKKLDAGLVSELVTESYLLVVEHNLPKKLWPVNPQTFAQPPADR